MRLPYGWIAAAILAAACVAMAQMPTYKLGRPPSQEEIHAMDTIVGPRGTELPPGKGTPREGEAIFMKKCVACHGRNGEGTKIASQVIGDIAVESYPFATSMWSFIYNGMPRNPAAIGQRDGTLTPDEAYGLIAYILYKDKIIKEDDVMDAQTLPRVHMPSRDHHLDGMAPAADAGKK